MENGKWIQIKASAPVAYLSDVEAVMGMISNSLMTEDYSDIEKDLDGVYGDLIDEELLARDRSTCAVSAFISDSANPAESVSFARGRFDELKIPAQIDRMRRVRGGLGGFVEEVLQADQDRKKGRYRPRVGEVRRRTRRGDGAHGSRNGVRYGNARNDEALCRDAREVHTRRRERARRGLRQRILAITAAKLGAADAFACDIDPQSIKVAKENTVLNSTPCVECAVSDPSLGGAGEEIRRRVREHRRRRDNQTCPRCRSVHEGRRGSHRVGNNQ